MTNYARALFLSNTAEERFETPDIFPDRFEFRQQCRDIAALILFPDALPFGRLWYGEPNAVSNAIDYAKHRSRSHNAVIRVYDEAGNVIEPKGTSAMSKYVLDDSCTR
jgi:hypothetical protein